MSGLSVLVPTDRQAVIDGRGSKYIISEPRAGLMTPVPGPPGPQGPATEGSVYPVSFASGMGFSLESRAAAENATVPVVIQVFSTLGYSAAGDGGGATYKRVSVEPAHAGKVQTADGAWWEISDARLNVLQFGVVADGVTDCTAAFQSAINATQHLFVPEGTYLLMNPVRITDKDFCMVGAGKDVTVILGGAVGKNGIEIRTEDTTYGSKSRPAVTIQDLTLSANVAGAGKAIDAVMTIAHEVPNVYGDATTVALLNVDIRGDDHYSSNTKYWTHCIYLADTGAVYIGNCRLLAANSVAGSYGIYIKDETSSNMRFSIVGGGVWHCQFGIVLDAKAPFTIEGVYITNYEIVACIFGVRGIGGPIHAVEISNSHIDTDGPCISFASDTGSSTLTVSNCYLQRGDKATGTPSSGNILDLPNCSEARIFGNNILGDSRVTHYGVAITKSNNCLVFGNSFQSTLGAAVLVNADDAGGTGTKVFGNTTVGAYPMVVNGANFSDQAGANFSNSQNGTKEIFGVADVTLESTGAGWLVLPNGGFKNAVSGAVVSNGNPLGQSQAVGCDLSLSEKTMLLIVVTPNPGVGTYRVNYIAKGN